jgi:ubiquinone biosynthesis accessory factor UbiJ
MVTRILERAINRYLQLMPQTLLSLSALSGNVIKIELTNWNIIFYVLLCDDSIRLEDHYAGAVQASIKGSSWTLFRLGFTPDDKVAALASQLEILGNVELAQTIRHIFQESHIDWEEPLSHVVGDIAAHQIGNIFRALNSWGKQVIQSTEKNITEYLQEEVRYLPPKLEVEDFFSNIHLLRNDLELLQTRWKKILRRIEQL